MEAMLMERKTVKVWFDPEGDYLEVMLEEKSGYFRETSSDQAQVIIEGIGPATRT